MANLPCRLREGPAEGLLPFQQAAEKPIVIPAKAGLHIS
jgi:hypothetical protein